MKVFEYEAVVIGSGAAGYNAVCRLKEFGVNVLLVTEGVNIGTSRNTGSDKQTYYKLSIGGDGNDSVKEMAKNLFNGGSVDGDNALCEAALSTRSFLHLAELGVPFPVNRYGEYVGYKTDHDPYTRATSAGPLTSKFMTEALQKRAEELEVPIFDGYLAIEILKEENRVAGLLLLEIKSGELVAIKSPDIVMCTGGPAGIYADSVYPECHTGTTSLALEAGAEAQNLTEWQYGLASINPRWNVSGTYMQVLPRFVSVDEEGREYEFLLDFFGDEYTALSNVFLKGYQWPFDSKKVLDGSSVIDLLVFTQRVSKKRRVYLDYTKNPFGLEKIDFENLSGEAYEYLKNAQATFGTPIQRLEKMNLPAIDLYRDKGVDISKEYLEIALCAQHNNGGIAVDMWWQTTVRGLFAAGECAGTHGVARPGGSALNAGQVGSLRAAQYISKKPNQKADNFDAIVEEAEKRHIGIFEKIKGQDNITVLINDAKRFMSDLAGAIRSYEKTLSALEKVKELIANIEKSVKIKERESLFLYYKYKDILITQSAVLTAFLHYSHTVSGTRGSALYYDENGELREGLCEQFRFVGENTDKRKEVQMTKKSEDGFTSYFRKVRQIPEDDSFFENVWRSYRENENIY